jgi:hypothetical protein
MLCELIILIVVVCTYKHISSCNDCRLRLLLEFLRLLVFAAKFLIYMCTLLYSSHHRLHSRNHHRHQKASYYFYFWLNNICSNKKRKQQQLQIPTYHTHIHM